MIRLGRKKPKSVASLLRGLQVYASLLARAGVVMAGVFTILGMSAARADLPVPCGGGACAPAGGPSVWVSSGAATASINGAAMTVHQSSDKAVLNWQSFNVGAGNHVDFQQPGASSVAVNRIFQADASRILGKVTANGQLVLINANGIIFGNGAQVNAGSLIASSLNITQEALDQGLARAIEASAPAFTAARGPDGEMVSKYVEIQVGATLQSADGGQIFVFAPNVFNGGTIVTPGGQATLAAGTKIYLQQGGGGGSASLPGLTVEVDVEGVSDETLTKFLKGELTELPLGNVHNNDTLANKGTISATAGTVSLVGLAVNQTGRISATTSVRAGGSIFLRARDTQDSRVLTAEKRASPTRAGAVTLAAGSVTEVLPAYEDVTTTVDANVQPVSRIDIAGTQIHAQSGARVTANGGVINIVAQRDPSLSESDLRSAPADGSRIVLESGSIIDASGATAELAADRNTLTVELRGEELKDSPLQRDSVLRGEKITVDLRQSGVREDGTTWVGTPLADLDGAIEAREHTVAERSAVGGTINLVSQGDIIVAPGATVDVTGGRIDYTAGYIATTKLIEQGRVVDISAADPTHRYDRIFGSVTRTSAKWGTEETWQVNGAQATYVAAYSEGRSAGTVSFNATNIILDGELRGGVSIGPFQRTSGANMPLGGQLIVGDASEATIDTPDFRVGDIVWREALAMPAPGFDPLHDAIPGGNAAVVLRPSLFSTRGMSRGVILSNGTITIEEDASLALPAGGSLELRGSAVDIAGDISVVSGAVKITAGRTVVNADVTGHDVALAPGVTIDVSGAWTNDLAEVSGAARGPVRIDGGSVALTSKAGSVIAPAGVAIDVSGAAWLQSNGTVRDGKGGSITLAATAPEPEAQVELGAALRGVALKRGGSLNLTTHGVCVGTASCAGADDMTTLTPDFFSNGGFADYSIKAKGADLVITGDAPVHAQQSNALLSADYWRQPSGTPFSAFSQMVTLPDHQRRPVNLSFGVGFATRGTRPSELHVERGAQIVTEPGGSVTLQASSRLWIDGSIAAPAGAINVVLDNAAGGGGNDYRPEQALWLGSHAVLDTSGVVKSIPDPAGWRLGDVLPGGNVTLRADRGYVITEDGSRIDVSGTVATLDLPSVGGTRTAQQVASNAGTLRVNAAEGAVLAGQINGAAGSATALGGTLALTINAATRDEPTLAANFGRVYHYPFAPRVIDVVASGAADRLAGATYETFGADYTSAHNGVAVVPMDQVSAGGFDALELTARHLIDVDHTDEVKAPAAIRLSADVDVARRVVLDAPTIDVAGPSIRVAAPYVALGSTDTITQFTPPPQAGTNEMRVLAQWIDVVGNSTVTGARHVTLDSAGDIRLRAAPELDTTVRELRGGLAITGTLDLHADQIYPATLTEFTVQAFDALPGVAPGAVVVHAGDGSSPVLSAGGTLHVRAQHIEQRGVVKAPFGTVDLQARADDGSDGTLILAPSSLTSVSGEDQTILMGRTEGGLDWTYKLGSGSSVSGKKFLFDGDVDALPQGRIELSGGVVDLQADAQLNVAAGGDMLATEFVPGIGGSRDVLANDATPRSYAIMPMFGDTVAPFDHAEYQGFAVKPGTTVHLDGGNGLPAGEYALLPARYALLPGAFLITEQAALRDMPAGRTVNLPNGTVVVAGYYGVAGTAQREDRSRGFAVLSSDVLRDPTNSLRPAEYSLTTASAFFGADGASSTPSRLPYDAGTVSIAATTGLQLQATLLGDALEQGRGAAVDIAAKELVIVADGGASISSGGAALPIRASDLNRLGAESIALGARRTDTANGTELNVVADRVTLAEGAQLVAPELLLAAKDNITLDGAAVISGSGDTTNSNVATHYVVAGDSAVLRVASGAAAELTRSDVTGSTSSMTIAEGATVAATGAALLDTTSDLTFAGDMQVSGADLTIGAPSIHLGAAPDDASGFVLDADAVRELDAASVTLRSRSAINLYGPVALQADDLVFDAASVIARSGERDAASEFRGEHVRFTNSSAIDASAVPDAVHGRLAVHAADIELGAGTYLFAGFDEVSLAADRTLLGVGEATLNVVAATDATSGVMDGGNVHLAAATLGGGRGADVHIAADGAVAMSSTAAPVALADDAIGATLNIRGASITDNAYIAAHAGSITLEATGPGGIQLGGQASIDAAGVMREFDTARAYAPAGDITLIARAGDITSAAGSRLSVAGADGGDGAGGDAGSVTLRAMQGTVDVRGEIVATAVADARDGRFALDASYVGDIDDLNARLDTGEFHGARTFRVREGDVALNTAIQAQRIDIIADGANSTGGALRVNTTLNASGNKGGQVRLVARGDVVLSDGASIDVSAHGAGRDGGSVDLFSATGGVRLDGGSRINAAAGPDTTVTSGVDGNVHVRVQRDVLSAVVSGDPRVSLGGAIDDVSEIVVEGVQSYEVFSGSLSSSDIDAYAAPAYFDAESFMASAAGITAALGRTDDARFHIRPGVEFYSADDLSLDAPWDLLAWRFNASSTLPGGESGYLTLRAGGDLTLNYTLSDALRDDGLGLQPQAGPSWSYRLVAGADFDSAAPFSVMESPDAGDFILAGAAGGFGFPGEQTAVRTGTGAIEIVAVGDVELKNDTSVIYTVGAPITDGISQSARDALLYEVYFAGALSDHGGDISIRAGGDARGATSDQLITDWWWRVGADVASSYKVPTAWGSVAPRFRQGVGALGGGDVTIEAVGNIDRLSAVVPTVGAPIGPSRDDYATAVRGGGDLEVRARGDIRGGVYYVEHGRGLLSAGGDITSGGPLAPQANVMNPWYTTLALGDAQFDVQAGGRATLGAIVNPAILPTTLAQSDATSQGLAPYFVTYGAAAGVHVAAVGGNAELHNDALYSQFGFTTLPFSPSGFGNGNSPESTVQILTVLPPVLDMVAYTGDVIVGQEGALLSRLLPSAAGQVELLAHGDVDLGRNVLLLSDGDRSLLPTLERPHIGMALLGDALSYVGRNAHSPTPVHAPNPASAVAPVRPVLIVAKNGDVTMTPANGYAGPVLAKPVRIVAGRDIVNLQLEAQNLSARDVSVISAGRDMVNTVARTTDGTIASPVQSYGIRIGGPGNLLVSAGRDIDLKTSPGIDTIGNQLNPALAEQGANVTLLAGALPEPDYAAFIARYLVDVDTHHAALTAFFVERGGDTPVDIDAQIEQFYALPRAEQSNLLTQILFAELRSSGRAAADAGSGDFSAGATAIETLFPTLPEQPRTGDVSLYFSRVYTLDGGDINVLVPGGTINVGLSTPPDAFGISKGASQLGIVAQRTGDVNIYARDDVLVNSSRVFAADGGNILMWSALGDIDAGRGAKTAISAPAPVVTFDDQGRVNVEFPPALAGSGIRAFVTTPGRKAGDVDLFAPSGVINAGDAGIGTAGNLTVAATQVLGADNFDVGGVSVGVPVVDTGAFASSLSSVGNVAGGASKSAEAAVSGNVGAAASTSATPLADEALSFLEVTVLGFGDEQTKP